MKTVSPILERHICHSVIATHRWRQQFLTLDTAESRWNHAEKPLDNNSGRYYACIDCRGAARDYL